MRLENSEKLWIWYCAQSHIAVSGRALHLHVCSMRFYWVIDGVDIEWVASSFEAGAIAMTLETFQSIWFPTQPKTLGANRRPFVYSIVNGFAANCRPAGSIWWHLKEVFWLPYVCLMSCFQNWFCQPANKSRPGFSVGLAVDEAQKKLKWLPFGNSFWPFVRVCQTIKMDDLFDWIHFGRNMVFSSRFRTIDQHSNRKPTEKRPTEEKEAKQNKTKFPVANNRRVTKKQAEFHLNIYNIHLKSRIKKINNEKKNAFKQLNGGFQV